MRMLMHMICVATEKSQDPKWLYVASIEENMAKNI